MYAAGSRISSKLLPYSLQRIGEAAKAVQSVFVFGEDTSVSSSLQRIAAEAQGVLLTLLEHFGGLGSAAGRAAAIQQVGFWHHPGDELAAGTFGGLRPGGEGGAVHGLNFAEVGKRASRAPPAGAGASSPANMKECTLEDCESSMGSESAGGLTAMLIQCNIDIPTGKGPRVGKPEGSRVEGQLLGDLRADRQGRSPRPFRSSHCRATSCCGAAPGSQAPRLAG